jgi:PBS lyase HEAT-like repeat
VDLTVKLSQRQFLEEIATHYSFTGDTRTVFLSRFDEVNGGKINKVLATYIEWNADYADKAQKLQDELDTICQVLEQNGCTIKRVSADVKKRGRPPKGQSPWEQVLKWLWEEKFPEWQQRHDQNNAVPSEQTQKNAVCCFLAEIENSFKYIRLLHIREQRIVLQDQYIPIQVTLERKYKHEVETIFSYAESEAELKRAYSLKHQEESQPTQVDWAKAKKQHQRIMVLADPGMGIKEQTKETLSYIKPQAVQELIYVLKYHKDVLVKEAVARAFFQMRDTQTIPALISALNDQYGNVVNPALEALAQIGTSDILEKLIDNPEIDIYRPDIFLLARKLALRFGKERLPFIPVYPKLVNRE